MFVTSFDNNGRFLKQEVYAELAAKELPGTTIARCNQLHDKDLVLGKNCKCAFDVLSSELKSKLLYGGSTFYEASLRHLIKLFPFENIILQCSKVLHSDSCTSDSSLVMYLNTWQEINWYNSEC